jgi:DNA ligase (NAD+)
LAAVHEIGDVIAESVHDFFHNEAGKKVVAQFKAVGIDPTMPKPRASASANLPLAGQTVVVTGTLPTLKREEAEALIVQMGGRPGGSVSKKTSFVVAGEAAGSKLAKAKARGIDVVDEAGLLEKVRTGGSGSGNRP